MIILKYYINRGLHFIEVSNKDYDLVELNMSNEDRVKLYQIKLKKRAK